MEFVVKKRTQIHERGEFLKYLFLMVWCVLTNHLLEKSWIHRFHEILQRGNFNNFYSFLENKLFFEQYLFLLRKESFATWDTRAFRPHFELWTICQYSENRVRKVVMTLVSNPPNWVTFSENCIYVHIVYKYKEKFSHRNT